MKYILTSLLGVHGLIHALGFAEAFGLSQPPQLQLAISRPWVWCGSLPHCYSC